MLFSIDFTHRTGGGLLWVKVVGSDSVGWVSTTLTVKLSNKGASQRRGYTAMLWSNDLFLF